MAMLKQKNINYLSPIILLIFVLLAVITSSPLPKEQPEYQPTAPSALPAENTKEDPSISSTTQESFSDIAAEPAVKIRNFLLADTPAERQQGLSNRDKLGEGQIMIFVFDRQNYHGIWMKDMNFPLDIVWLDRQKKIITIKENVAPESYPEIFLPTAPSLYVLEMGKGTASKLELEIGKTVKW